MLAEVRRFGADLVRFQVSQAGARPEVAATTIPPTATRCSTRSPRPGTPASTSSSRCSGRERRADATGAACRRPRPGAPGARSPPELGRRPRRPARDLQRAAGQPPDPGGMGALAEVDAGDDRRAARGGVAERAAGPRDAVLAQSFDGAPPLDDPLGQLGYAVHPYLGRHNQTRAQWEKKWGDFARTHPVMATEFNADAGGNYCRPELRGAGRGAARLPAPSSGSGSSPGRSTCRTCASRTAATPRSTTSSAASAATAAAAAPGR